MKRTFDEIEKLKRKREDVASSIKHLSGSSNGSIPTVMLAIRGYGPGGDPIYDSNHQCKYTVHTLSDKASNLSRELAVDEKETELREIDKAIAETTGIKTE